MKTAIVCLALCLMTACIPEPTVVSRTDFGEITDVQAVPTSFNECQKTMIKTTKGFTIVVGYHSCMKGDKATVTKYSDGSKYFHIEGKDRWRVMQ